MSIRRLPSCSHETLHKLEQLVLVHHTVAVLIHLVEEGVAHGLVERFFVAHLRKGCLRQWNDLISVEGSGAVFVIFHPECVDDDVPLRVVWRVVTRRGVSNFSGRGLVVVDAAIGDLVRMLVALLAFFFDRSNLFVLLLLHLLLLLKVHLLLLLLDNLVHEDCFVDALRGVEAGGPLAVTLNLMLVAHRDRTDGKKAC